MKTVGKVYFLEPWKTLGRFRRILENVRCNSIVVLSQGLGFWSRSYDVRASAHVCVRVCVCRLCRLCVCV